MVYKTNGQNTRPEIMNTKQVIVVRKDLHMRRGKEAAQVSHASLGAVFSGSYVVQTETGEKMKVIPLTPDVEEWFNVRFTKICLSCDSEAELLKLTEQAKDAGLLYFLCRDAGLTEFGGVPTYTTLAIGPAEASEIDKITKHLKLR
jgi:PTH2 family peptidyl-tRNA hydrolase